MIGSTKDCASLETEKVSGNIFIRPCNLLKKGDFMDGHQHHFDHTTIFFRGSFKVNTKEPDGSTAEYKFTAPDYMLIKKEVEHRIEATSDEGGLFWCVYSHRGPDGEIVQEYTNKAESYS